MNRVLRRPMFRTGGSAEGITSGLDQTKLTASRPGYNRGRVVNPGGYQGDDDIDRALKSMDDERVQKFIRGERRPYLPQFLMSMGLDLATRPRSGNIFQQVATSAKGPLDKWMETRAAREGVDDKLSAALFGDVMDIETRKYEAEKKVEAERVGAGGKKDYEYKGKLEDYEKLIDEGQRLANELAELEAVTPSADQFGPQRDEAAIKDVKDKLEKNALLQQLFADEEEDPIRKAILDGIPNMVTTFADLVYYDQTKEKTGKGKIPPNLLEEKAEGGRVGYQGGGMSLPSAAPATMPAAVPVAGTMDQGAEQDSSVQDLSFEELRARLPQEITNDIVKLLTESKQALVDFANIRTQQDINSFNQKYDVNLVVPQEA